MTVYEVPSVRGIGLIDGHPQLRPLASCSSEMERNAVLVANIGMAREECSGCRKATLRPERKARLISSEAVVER
jgi:hypothetical protein